MRSLPPLFEDRTGADRRLGGTPPGGERLAGSPAGGPLWRGLLLVMLIFFGTRAVTWTAAYQGAHAAWRIQQQLPPPLPRAERQLATLPANAPELLARRELLGDFAPLCQWDARWYRSVIDEGYSYQAGAKTGPVLPGFGHNIAFFPLYPLVCRPLTAFLSTPAAMILVAHTCALAAAVLIYWWVRRRIDESVALVTVALTFSFPVASYFSFGYAESLTLLLAVAALGLIDRGAFWPAALACGLATATRPTAAPLAAVLLIAYWLNTAGTRRGKLAASVPLGLLSLGGALAYAGFLWARFGSPLVYAENFKHWTPDAARPVWYEFLGLARVWDQFKYLGRTVRDFPEGVLNLANALMWNVPFVLFILFISLAGLPRVPRRFRPLLLLAPAIFLYAYAAAGGANFGVEPIARYLNWCVPAFVVLAAWCVREWKAWVQAAFFSGLLLLQAAQAYRFALGEWCG